jgi:hypothetical protein
MYARGRAIARIKAYGNSYRCGPFESSEIAAYAYNCLVRKFFGENAYLNNVGPPIDYIWNDQSNNLIHIPSSSNTTNMNIDVS